jgi:ABC-type thiamine transport system ATPase subunit
LLSADSLFKVLSYTFAFDGPAGTGKSDLLNLIALVCAYFDLPTIVTTHEGTSPVAYLLYKKVQFQIKHLSSADNRSFNLGLLLRVPLRPVRSR